MLYWLTKKDSKCWKLMPVMWGSCIHLHVQVRIWFLDKHLDFVYRIMIFRCFEDLHGIQNIKLFIFILNINCIQWWQILFWLLNGEVLLRSAVVCYEKFRFFFFLLQLIILMALAEGKSEILCGPLSLHTETAIHVASIMTKVEVTTACCNYN